MDKGRVVNGGFMMLLTAKDQAQLDQLFAIGDKNRDGKFSSSEIKALA